MSFRNRHTPTGQSSSGFLTYGILLVDSLFLLAVLSPIKMLDSLRSAPLDILGAFGRATKAWTYDYGWKLIGGFVASAYLAPELTYWTGMGILSSIGLGSGCHTGPLVLFPYVAGVALEEGNFQAAAWRVLFPTLCWGIGTALGEIPPYYAGPALLDSLSEGTRNSRLFVSAQKMVVRHGTLGIFALSCYPNPLFDAAGMTAGIVGMPMYKFVCATIAGKGFVKAPMQSVLVIFSALAGRDYVEISSSYGALSLVGRVFACLVLLAAMLLSVELVAKKRLLHELPNRRSTPPVGSQPRTGSGRST